MYSFPGPPPKNDTQLIYRIWEEFSLPGNRSTQSSCVMPAWCLTTPHCLITGSEKLQSKNWATCHMSDVFWEVIVPPPPPSPSESLSTATEMATPRKQSVTKREAVIHVQAWSSESFRWGCQEELTTAFMGMEVLACDLLSDRKPNARLGDLIAVPQSCTRRNSAEIWNEVMNQVLYNCISEKGFYPMPKGRAEQRVTDRLYLLANTGFGLNFASQKITLKKKKAIQFYIHQDY